MPTVQNHVHASWGVQFVEKRFRGISMSSGPDSFTYMSSLIKLAKTRIILEQYYYNCMSTYNDVHVRTRNYINSIIFRIHLHLYNKIHI